MSRTLAFFYFATSVSCSSYSHLMLILALPYSAGDYQLEVRLCSQLDQPTVLVLVLASSHGFCKVNLWFPSYFTEPVKSVPIPYFTGMGLVGSSLPSRVVPRGDSLYFRKYLKNMCSP